MPDDYDGDGAPPSGPGGRRRAPDQDQPKRRRRSLDDDGGLSVSDLVERHSASRVDLPAVGRRHAADTDAPTTGRRRAAEDPGPQAGHRAPEQPHHPAPPPGRRGPVEEPPHPPAQAGRRGPAPEPDSPVGRRGAVDDSRHAAPEPPRPVKRGGIEDLGAAMQGRRAAADQSDAPPSRHGRRRAAEQPPGRAPRQGEPPRAVEQLPGRAPRQGEPPRAVEQLPGRAPRQGESPRAAEPSAEPPRRAPRRPAPGPAGGPPMPSVEPGGPQRASIPADVVRQATGAHRIPGDAGLDFDQFVPAEPPPRRPAPRPAPGPALPEPTQTGDFVEDDRPSSHYPVPARHEPFPRDHHEPQQAGDHFPAARPPARPAPMAQDDTQGRRGPAPHDGRGSAPHDDAYGRPGPHDDAYGGRGPEARPAPHDARPRRRPAAPHQLPPDVDGEPFGSGAPNRAPSGHHTAPDAGRGPSGQHPFPPDAEPRQRPDAGRRPSGQHQLPQGEPFDGPRGGPAPRSHPPHGDPLAHRGGRPLPADAPPPGPRQATGQHPLPQGEPGRPPHATGQHPLPPADGGRPTGRHPLPHPTGQHQLPPADPGRPHPTGQHPLPLADSGRPHPTGQHPLPLADSGRPHPTGQHPLPPADPGRPHPAPGGATPAGPMPGAPLPGGPGPGGPPRGGPDGEPRRHPTGQHPLPQEARRQPTGDLALPPDAPQPSGRFPRPQPTGAMALPGHRGPDGETFPDDRSPFPEPSQQSGLFPVDHGAGDARPTGDGKPRIPRQQPPGQSSMPNQTPNQQANQTLNQPANQALGQLGAESCQTGPEETQKVGLTPPPGVTQAEAVGMTTEMEPIGEATQKRRRVDETLARFSKVHDELKAEERAKRAKRRVPWGGEDDELEEQLDELAKPPGEESDQDEKPKPRKRGLFARVFAGTTAILVFVGTGVGWGFLKHTGDSIDKVRALDPDSAAIQNAEAQTGDENFLLIGSDTRDGADAEDGVGDASEVPGARADTMMIAHVPADRSRVVIVSFPRDLEISRPDCERFDPATNTYTGETVPGVRIAKLNTAFQVGGPLCATKVAQEISGLRVTRFIGIDFHGFKGMVDAVDGVTVCVEEPMYDTFLNKWIVQKAGKDVQLRGDQALDFVRSRHVRGDKTSDYGRIKRQQRFLSSLLRKSMSGQVLLDPAKLTGFTQAFTKSTFGDNITVESLFSLGQSLQGLDAGRVTFLTVPTVGIANDRGNEELRVEDNAALFRAIVNNQPLPGEKPTPSSDTDEEQRALPQSSPLRLRQQQADPKTLKVQVLNGGNPTGGMARRTAESLAEYGYQIVLVNSAPKVPKSVVYYGTGNEAAARTLASSVPGVLLKAEPGMGKALMLVLGPEYDGEVVPPGTADVTEPEPEKLPGDLSVINGGDVRCA